MKKKSPDKGSSYKNLDSVEMQEIRTSPESWAKFSFIELLVTILVKTRGLIDSLYFHIRFLPNSSRNSGSNYKFLRNVSVFFVLFLFIPIYRNEGITKQKDFIFRKIQRQTHSESFYIDKDIKYNSKLGRRFEPFWYKLRSLMKIVKVHKDSPFDLLLFHKKSLVYNSPKFEKYEWIGKSNWHKYFFGSHLYSKTVSNKDLYLLGQTSIGYPINSKDLGDIFLKSRDGNSSFLNCIECNSHRIFINYYWCLWKSVQQQKILANDKPPYIFDQLVNSDLEANLDDILSIMRYRNLKFISRKAKYSNDWTVDRIFIKIFFGHNSCLIHAHIDKRIEADEENKTSPVNLTKYYKYYFEWLTRVMYMEYKQLLDPGPIYKISPVKLFFLEATKSCEQIPKNKNKIHNSIHSQKDIEIVDSRSYISKTFSKQFLINYFDINTNIDRNVHRILKENRNRHYLNKFVGMRGVGITFFTKIQKYYSKRLFHFFLPFNSVYSIGQQNSIENNKILKSWQIWEHFLFKVFHRLLPIHRISSNSNIFVNQMELNRNLKNNKSNLSRNLAKKVQDLHLSESYINQSLLAILCLDWKIPTDCSLIEPFIVRPNNLLELFVFFSKIPLNLVKKSELVLMPNFLINWNRGFYFHSNSFSIWDLDIIDPLFFVNLSKFYEFALRVFGDKSPVTERVNSTPTNLQLSADSRMLYKNRIKSKFFPEVFDQFHLEYFFVRIPVPKPNGEMRVKFHADSLRYVLSMRHINLKMSRVISKILPHLRLESFRFKGLESKVPNRVPLEKNISFEYSRFGRYFSSTKLILFTEYMSWFFTPEWWGYHTDMFLAISGQTFSMIRYYLKYLGSLYIQIVREQFKNSWGIEKNIHEITSESKSEMFTENGDKIVLTSNRYLNYLFIKSWHGLWAIITFICFISILKQNLFSIVIGSNSLCLWKHFETIEYLTQISKGFHSLRSINLTKEGLKKTNNLVIHIFENLKRYVRNVQFYLLMNKGLDDWLIHNKGLDLSRREKSPLVQSLITCTRIENYGFKSYPKQNRLSYVSGYRVTNQQGFSYLRYLSGILKKKLVNYPLVLTNKWIHLASLQRMIFSRTLLNFDVRVPQIPVPLQFGLSPAKGILLIGAIETGRSYLVKNLAANSRIPLLGIHIDKFLYNKPDVLTESWISILIESLRGLNLILDLANEMSPCMIWIRNIHRLDVNHPTLNIESEPAFLLGILSKYFQTNPTKTRTRRNVIIIGSTYLPGKVDPALISADRLDQIINIRSSNNSWRKNHFFILLNTKNLRLKSDLLYPNKINSKTTGYTTRDLAALTNEVSLISIAKNKSFVCNNTIELAFHRQILRFTHINDKSYFLQNSGILFYKIGRAIIQNLLIESSTMNPLSISNYSWKKNFYHLAEWYLESSLDKSIVKEFVIMIHALGCLAGLAARDSWFLLEKESDTSIALDRSVENDLGFASSILESLALEFSRLEICENRFITYKQQGHKVSLAMNSSNIIQNGLFALTGEDTIRNYSKDKSSISRHIFLSGIDLELQSTAWSPRPWRLSFCRSNLFDWIKRPNDSEWQYRLQFSKNEKRIISSKLDSHYNPNQLMGKGKQQLIYERILPRVRKRNVQELEFQLELILSEEQSEILGFRRPPTLYQMEYQADNKPKFFIGKRILWDPTGSFTRIRNPIFSRREFFMDEEILRRLYVTYGVRRERERSLFNHKIKRFFLRRGYNKELINKLSIRWWDQLPTHEEQSIDTWKRIEEIGVRLRRPQVFTPVYLYQRWLIENLPEKFPRFELLTHRQRWLGVTNLSPANSFAYTTLLESYQYLLEFLSSKKELLDQAMKTLLIKKWLFQNEIGYLIHNFNRKNNG
jgi:hypothetical protein